MSSNLISILHKTQNQFVSIVPIDFQRDKYLVLDLSVHNPETKQMDLHNIPQMDAYIFGKMAEVDAQVAVGGYDEERSVYAQSEVFQGENEARSIHLGIDLWMPAETPIFAPYEAKVHSFANNANFGDYGPTIILEHQIENQAFYTLYGHLTIDSLSGLYEGKIIPKGTQIGKIGSAEVNGGWSAHLHFQIIRDMLDKKGDFIGVAYKSQREDYLQLCPNPNLILQIPALI